MPSRATVQDGTYPRPQLVREDWTDLSGPWQFAADPGRAGLRERWQAGADPSDRAVFGADITVPYPPEAPLSGVGETGPHPVVWYRRTLPLGDVAGLDAVRARGHRLVLRFGAVDHRARVWLDGALVATHEGGQTPFAADLTDALDAAALAGQRDPVLVVRAEDDPRDTSQPRGKQDWQDDPHSIWYHRTTGIWQPVWLEVVPAVALERLTWTSDVPAGVVRLDVVLTAVPEEPVSLAVRLEIGGRLLAEQTARLEERRASVTVTVPALANGQALHDDLLWSPEHPRLVDADVRLLDGEGAEVDAAGSYLGLRDAAVGRGAFLLNGRPYYLRSVLEQGYWVESHLAAPDAAALRREVELIKELGFNAVRVHQKVEDPRFLHWCDRLGLLVWGETANAYAFTPEAVRQLTTEWIDVVARDAGHPCVVTWVPMNESWGVQHVARVPAQQQYTAALAALTRALDPSRPVISNDGWEHTDSDLWTIHDYAGTGEELTASYGSRAAFEEVLRGMGPGGRRLVLGDRAWQGQPVMLTEFGGVRYTPRAEREDAEGGQVGTWGYTTAGDGQDFAARLADLLGAVHASPVLAGFCYTQLTDTMQEANGLCDAQRRPKLPVEQLRAMITGGADGAA